MRLLKEQRNDLISPPFCLCGLLSLLMHRSLHTEASFSSPCEGTCMALTSQQHHSIADNQYLWSGRSTQRFLNRPWRSSHKTPQRPCAPSHKSPFFFHSYGEAKGAKPVQDSAAEMMIKRSWHYDEILLVRGSGQEFAEKESCWHKNGMVTSLNIVIDVQKTFQTCPLFFSSMQPQELEVHDVYAKTSGPAEMF